jgi:hypothetical protein
MTTLRSIVSHLFFKLYCFPGPYFFGTNQGLLEPSIQTYKKKFDRDLRHIKIILAHERHAMPVKEWLRLVHETKESILNFPEEFFCSELPARDLYSAAIEKVFAGFLEDQRLLAMQTSKGFKIPTEKKG